MASHRRDNDRTEGRAQERLWPDIADRSSGVRAKKRADLDPSELVSGLYRLLGPLGESSYGRAIRAEHAGTHREVALHMIPDGMVSERVLARELPLAVAKCAQLTHPNVVTLQAFGRVDGDSGPFYVVTDALEGVCLADYLHEQGEISLDAALALARQIGRALRAAHKLGIVHGDLRPANVRVMSTDDGLHVRVTGFGRLPLSRADDEPRTGVRSISAPTYASPELLRGEPLDPRTDVYALGAILYRMISGEPPFIGATAASVVHAHKHAPIPSLRESRARVGATVSEELDALVTRCLAKSKLERFPDVVAVMSAMRLLSLKDGDFLSRDFSEVSSLSPGRINSILPTVAAGTDPADEQTVITPDPKLAASLRRFWIAAVLMSVLAVVGALYFELSR